MKSIIARLEALEARSQQSLVLLVTFKDGSTKEMCVAEFKEKSKELCYGDSVNIASGSNQKELGEYIDIIIEMMDDIANNPVPDRNIEDYE